MSAPTARNRDFPAKREGVRPPHTLPGLKRI